MDATQPKEKILIIESDTAFGNEVSDFLAKNGYRVILANEGAQGFQAMIDNLPNIIILDAAVTGMESYEVLEKKQAEPMLAKIPTILVSTQVAPINMRRVPQGSVSEYVIALHVEPKDILEKVNKYLGNDIKPAEQMPVPDVAKKKLLWVEDDRLIGTILSKKLLSSGFDLIHAKNGDEALAALKAGVPDVIALDLVLPNMSGFDILQEAKKDPRTANVPVIILSNLSKQSDIERAKLLGAQKFLVKAAVSLDQIVEEVRGLLK